MYTVCAKNLGKKIYRKNISVNRFWKLIIQKSILTWHAITVLGRISFRTDKWLQCNGTYLLEDKAVTWCMNIRKKQYPIKINYFEWPLFIYNFALFLPILTNFVYLHTLCLPNHIFYRNYCQFFFNHIHFFSICHENFDAQL